MMMMMRELVIQCNEKVVQPTLKYLLMIAIQFDWINKHTLLLWLYNSPYRSHTLGTCSFQSVRHLSTGMQGCLYTNTMMFTDEHYLAFPSYITRQNEFRDTFPISPVPTKQYLIWRSIPMTQELCTGLHQTRTKTECMHC
jgi:hypothetical protein